MTDTRETDIIEAIAHLERAYAELAAARKIHPHTVDAGCGLPMCCSSTGGMILRAITDLEIELLDFPGL